MASYHNNALFLGDIKSLRVRNKIVGGAKNIALLPVPNYYSTTVFALAFQLNTRIRVILHLNFFHIKTAARNIN